MVIKLAIISLTVQHAVQLSRTAPKELRQKYWMKFDLKKKYDADIKCFKTALVGLQAHQ